MKKSLKKGFTLIELLVVIAIIGILATIVIINVASARQKADQASAASSLDSLRSALSQCQVDGGIITTPTATTGGNEICTNPVLVNWPTNLVIGNGSYAVQYSASTSETNFTITATAKKLTKSSTAGAFCQLSCTAAGCTKNTNCY